MLAARSELAMRRFVGVFLVVLAIQLPIMFWVSTPTQAYNPANPLRIDLYVDPDNFISREDNGSPGDPTYTAFCGANAGAWKKGAWVYNFPEGANDNTVTMILRYRNAGTIANQANVFFVIYTPPRATVLNYGVASTVYGEPEQQKCAGNNVSFRGADSNIDPYVKGQSAGHHVWFQFAPGRIPAGYTGTLFVRYRFNLNERATYQQHLYYYEVQQWGQDSTADTPLRTSNVLRVGKFQPSYFEDIQWNLGFQVNGAKSKISWNNPTVYNNNRTPTISVAWPMIISGPKYVQTGWFKDQGHPTTIEFVEYGDSGTGFYLRKLRDSGMTNTTHVYAIEYDPNAFPQYGGRWCGNIDGNLCYETFFGNDAGITSGPVVQYFSETYASIDQLGGTETTKNYHYEMSYKRAASSVWTLIPQTLPPSGTNFFDAASGTPYRGNHYWDTVSVPNSWAFVNYTIYITPH
jgi:hypothetical protein